MTKKYTFDPVPAPLPVFRPLLDSEGKTVKRIPATGEWCFSGELVYKSVAGCVPVHIYTREFPPSDLVQVEPTGEVRAPVDGDLFLDNCGKVQEGGSGYPRQRYGDLGTRRVILREVRT